MNEKFENKHSKLPKERRLPWLALNEVSLFMFLDAHAYNRSRVIQLILLCISQAWFLPLGFHGRDVISTDEFLSYKVR